MSFLQYSITDARLPRNMQLCFRFAVYQILDLISGGNNFLIFLRRYEVFSQIRKHEAESGHIRDGVLEPGFWAFAPQLLHSAVSSSGWSRISRWKVGSHSSAKVKTVQESVIGISCRLLLTPQRSMRVMSEKVPSQHSEFILLGILPGCEENNWDLWVLWMCTNILLS